MQRAESRLPAMKLPTSEETTTAGDQKMLLFIRSYQDAIVNGEVNSLPPTPEDLADLNGC